MDERLAKLKKISSGPPVDNSGGDSRLDKLKDISTLKKKESTEPVSVASTPGTFATDGSSPSVSVSPAPDGTSSSGIIDIKSQNYNSGDALWADETIGTKEYYDRTDPLLKGSTHAPFDPEKFGYEKNDPMLKDKFIIHSYGRRTQTSASDLAKNYHVKKNYFNDDGQYAFNLGDQQIVITHIPTAKLAKQTTSPTSPSSLPPNPTQAGTQAQQTNTPEAGVPVEPPKPKNTVSRPSKSVSPDEGTTMDRQALRNQAYELVKDKPAAAMAVTDVLLQRYPDDPYAYQLKAHQLELDKDYKGAATELTKAINTNPDDADLRAKRADLAVKAGMPQTATEDADAYIKAVAKAGQHDEQTAQMRANMYALKGDEQNSKYWNKVAEGFASDRQRNTEAQLWATLPDWMEEKMAPIMRPLTMPADMIGEGGKKIAEGVEQASPSKIASGIVDAGFGIMMSTPQGVVFNSVLTAGEELGFKELSEWVFAPVSMALERNGISTQQIAQAITPSFNAAFPSTAGIQEAQNATDLAIQVTNLIPSMLLMHNKNKGVDMAKQAYRTAEKWMFKLPVDKIDVAMIDKTLTEITPEETIQAVETTAEFIKDKAEEQQVSEVQQTISEPTYRIGKKLYGKDEFMAKLQTRKTKNGIEVVNDPETQAVVDDMFRPKVEQPVTTTTEPVVSTEPTTTVTTEPPTTRDKLNALKKPVEEVATLDNVAPDNVQSNTPNQSSQVQPDQGATERTSPEPVRAEATNVTSWDKAASASSRFRPMEVVEFDKPIVGPNGNQLTSYQWQYEWDMRPDREGEMKSYRKSNWEQAESSAATGRGIVHQFTVRKKDGSIVRVSSESVPIELGYMDEKQMKNFPNVVTAVKTLAKQRMQLSVLEAQLKEYTDLTEKYKAAEKPEIKQIEDPVSFQKEDQAAGRHNVFSMGDSWVRQDNEGRYDRQLDKTVFTQRNEPTKRTIEELTDKWVSDNVKKDGGKYPQGLYDLRNRVKRQEKKVEEITKSKTTITQSEGTGSDNINPPTPQRNEETQEQGRQEVLAEPTGAAQTAPVESYKTSTGANIYHDGNTIRVTKADGTEVPARLNRVRKNKDVKGKPQPSTKYTVANPEYQKAVNEYAKSVDLDKGESAFKEGEEYPDGLDQAKHISKNSTNPREIAEAYLEESLQNPFVEGDAIDEAITNHVGFVVGGEKTNSPGSFRHTNDNANITPGMRLNWFREDGTTLDEIARLASGEGVDVTPKNVADYIVKYPHEGDYLRKNANPNLEDLKIQFEYVTGLPLDESMINRVRREQAEKLQTTRQHVNNNNKISQNLRNDIAENDVSLDNIDQLAKMMGWDKEFIADANKYLEYERQEGEWIVSSQENTNVRREGKQVETTPTGILEKERTARINQIDSELAALEQQRKSERLRVEKVNSKVELPLDVAKETELFAVDQNGVTGNIPAIDKKIADLKTERTVLESRADKVAQADAAQTSVDKALGFLDSIKIDTKGKAFDATLGIPIAAWNTSIDIIKLGIKGGKVFADSLQDAIDWLKTNGHTFVEADYVKHFTDLFSKNENILRKEVEAELQNRYTEIEKKFFGSKTNTEADIKANKSWVNRVTGLLGLAQEKTVAKASDAISDKFATLAGKAISSQNTIVRNAAKSFESLVKNSFRTMKDTERYEQMVGESRERSSADANRINKELMKIIGNDANALLRVNQVVDPEFYRERTIDEFKDELIKDYGAKEVNSMSQQRIDDMYAEYRAAMGFDDPNYKLSTYNDLNPAEQKAADLIREIYDYIHDASFVMGKIPMETYITNKGTYAARLYDKYEFPEEINEMWKTAQARMQEGAYKQRGGLTDWKAKHIVENPVHGVTKRLYQGMFNKAVFDYSKWIAQNKPEWISKTEKKGYTLLGSGYGALSGRYVLDAIAEDFRGIFYTSKGFQAVYDAISLYDRNPLRKFYRGLLTVFNPAVQVGNHTGNIVFAAWNGISPIRFETNFWNFARKEMKEYGPTYRYLLNKGLLKSDMTRSDLMDSFKKLQELWVEGESKPNPLKWVADKAKKIYADNDDYAKLAAFKSLIDMGLTPEKALKRVADGYQNYKRVGKAYDFASKTPMFGSMFARWGGDLSRIVKSGLVTRPLNLAAFGASLHALAYVASTLSGESEEKRKIRENRIGFPSIPMPDALGGNIPLAIMLGQNELNLARFVSPLYIYSNSDGTEAMQVVNKFSPYQIESVDYTSNPSGKTAVWFAKNTRDPLIAPLISAGIPWVADFANSDWKGMPILDPTETKYKPGGLSHYDRGLNSLRFLARSYTPYGSYGDDFVRAIVDGVDYYGRTKTPGQVLLRFVGWNSQQFKEDRYYKTVEDESNVLAMRLNDVIKNAKNEADLLARGKITQRQLNDRMAEFWEDMAIIVKKMNDMIDKKGKYLSPKSLDELVKLKEEYKLNKKN